MWTRCSNKTQMADKVFKARPLRLTTEWDKKKLTYLMYLSLERNVFPWWCTLTTLSILKTFRDILVQRLRNDEVLRRSPRKYVIKNIYPRLDSHAALSRPQTVTYDRSTSEWEIKSIQVQEIEIKRHRYRGQICSNQCVLYGTKRLWICNFRRLRYLGYLYEIYIDSHA